MIERYGVFLFTSHLAYEKYDMFTDIKKGFYFGNRQKTENYIHKLAIL